MDLAWFLPNPIRSSALPSRCSNLIEECSSDVFLLCDQFNNPHETFLPQRTGDPQVPSDVCESRVTEAGTRQAIEATTISV